MNDSPPPAMPPAIRVAAGEDRFSEHRGLGISVIEFKVVPQDSSGLFVIENSFHARGGPPRHLHYEQDEWFYALEGEFLIEVEDPLGQSHRFGACDDHLERLGAGASPGDVDDLLAGQRLAGIDAEVQDAQQRDQRVDRRGPLRRHVVARGQEDPQARPHAVTLRR